MPFPLPRARAGLRALAVVLAGAVAAAGLRVARASDVATTAPGVTPVLAAADSMEPSRIVVDDTLRGRSGKLLARFVSPERPLVLEALQRLFGDVALSADRPSLLAYVDSALGGPSFSFITMRPFEAKADGRIGAYRIGFWPGETRAVRKRGYENPEGFIEVTRENRDLKISEHFRLGDFLTHGQESVWPKYLVLREDLVDKLELVIADLEAHGVKVQRMRVMSGFRTPQYNANGGDTRGRASLSRHMYGDAADVFVDNDGNWRMDDLNGDGKVDSRDAAVIKAAVERVERAHPDLVGGVGLYRATSAHGPFAHVDVRGYRARWGGA